MKEFSDRKSKPPLHYQFNCRSRAKLSLVVKKTQRARLYQRQSQTILSRIKALRIFKPSFQACWAIEWQALKTISKLSLTNDTHTRIRLIQMKTYHRKLYWSILSSKLTARSSKTTRLTKPQRLSINQMKDMKPSSEQIGHAWMTWLISWTGLRTHSHKLSATTLTRVNWWGSDRTCLELKTTKNL